MDRDATDVALAMSRNGIWIDEHRRQEYLKEYDERAAELEAQTLELTGAAARQPAAGVQLPPQRGRL
jgi:DNA polymerase I-like protein with 3'-5' exonuclease and polymerase domains